ncbi:hypothetical protein B0H16DRAFT_1721688 [Mycena metata]|uniref:Uncharacterized protein n=1 Tax=Mycena metata TaxID=1033252 RepID=A0AAD7J5B4_9AGAR|nr:hypothetical protein B0H16DRAFT_1721688 [Mycena metata]
MATTSESVVSAVSPSQERLIRDTLRSHYKLPAGQIASLLSSLSDQLSKCDEEVAKSVTCSGILERNRSQREFGSSWIELLELDRAPLYCKMYYYNLMIFNGIIVARATRSKGARAQSPLDPTPRSSIFTARANSLLEQSSCSRQILYSA